jgi:molybdopterin synthase catalytic subunit
VSLAIASSADHEINPTKVLSLIDITYEVIALDKLLAAVTTPACGAQVLFVGTTRQWTGATETTFLEYDSYSDMALGMLEKLESEARRRWAIEEVAIVHRLGRVDIGQASVAVAVGAAHRDAAFQAARWLIDEIKLNVPIWKREHGQADARWVHPQ